MLTDAFEDGDNGIPIRYRFDGKFFNLRRLQAKSKVQTEAFDEFLFADVMAKGAPTEGKMQKGVDQVSDSCDSYDLTISIKKTEVVYQPAPGKPYKEPTITVKGQRLQVVRQVHILGSTLSRVVHIYDEVNARIAKASAAFGRLRGSIWDRSGIRLDTKLKVHRSVVLPTLLYACEAWTVYQRHAKRLNHFHTSCLRKLLKIKWQDRILDTKVLKRAVMQCTYSSEIGTVKMGHVTRMPDESLPKKILYGELQVGKRSHGDQKKRYKDTLKATFKDFNIPTESWEQIAQDRTKWRGLIRRGAGEYGKSELRHHQQSFLPQTSLVLSATGSLELRLVSSAILEHTNNNTSQSWLDWSLSVMTDERTDFSLTLFFWPFRSNFIHTVNMSFCFVIICSTSLLLSVSQEVCTSWLWFSLGNFYSFVVGRSNAVSLLQFLSFWADKR